MSIDPTSIPQIDARETAFFLDVDGTLLGFKSRPEEVVADPDLITTLEALIDAADGALALVSGRMVSDLDRIMTPLHLPAGGLHGADIRFSDDRREVIDPAFMNPVRAAVTAFVSERAGLMLEDKGATLAIHYRHAPEREDEVRSFLAQIGHGHDLALQEGKLVAELKPLACNKGHAIAALMETAPFAGRRPLFIGDDLTDEYGFDAVNTMGGVSIKVGPPESSSKARYRIAHPEAVRELLKNIRQMSPASS